MTLDDIAVELQDLRFSVGNPSFADICKRISRARIANGQSEHQASVARSTVYDCFRVGRSRVNATLVAEIVSALTNDEILAAQWQNRCLAANSARSMQSEPIDSTITTSSATAQQEERELAVSITEDLSDDSYLAASRVPAPGFAERLNQLPIHSGRRSPQFILAIVMLAVVANLLPASVGQQLFGNYFPLFADMLGTAVVAMYLGPWWGALVGLVTALTLVNPIVTLSDEPLRLAFTLVAIAGALVWGFGVHRFKMASSTNRFVLLNLLVGVVCSLVAVPLVFAVFDGNTMMYLGQHMTEQVVASGTPLPLAVLISNLVISVADKMLIGFLAAGIIGVASNQQVKTRLGELFMRLRSRRSTQPVGNEPLQTSD